MTNLLFMQALAVAMLLFPAPAWAIQIHAAPEGLYAHQLAHVLFICAMAVLAYWLQANGFVQTRGWRLIQISCILFILWNVEAMVGHWVEGNLPENAILGPKGSWEQEVDIRGSKWAIPYYFLKLDHLLCVPAALYLYLGLKDLHGRVLLEASEKQ